MKRPSYGRNFAFRLTLLLVIILLAIACGKGGGPSLAPTPGLQDASPDKKGGGRTVLELAMDDFSAVQPGGTFTVTVRVRDAEDLYQFVSRLEYDAELLSPVEVAQGEFVPERALFVGAPRTDGIVPIAGTLVFEGDGVDGSGSLAEISFTKLIDAAPLTPPVRFTDDPDYLNLIDSAGDSLDFSLLREVLK